MTHVIDAHELVRGFGKGESHVDVIKEISLHLKAKEIVVLMGPSGSGKTTLLAMLGCLLRPTSGSIHILGKDITTLSSRSLAKLRAETIGFVFQSFNLLSALNVWENVALVGDFVSARPGNLRSHSMRILESIGLGHRVQHLPGDLSAGEKQRVAFARALVNNPKIILADEPTANLDAENRTVIMELLRMAVEKQHVSVMVATHDERIQHVADRVIRIEDGRLQVSR